MTTPLARLCARHGIECDYVGFDGIHRTVPEETLAALAEALGASESAAPPPAGIEEALAEQDPPRCHVPDALRHARLWGVTCQLASLASDRNAGMGDFADLAAFCRVVAEAGADFVGLNPLHALFWSDPRRVSPFFPSSRRFLNPLYIALDWVEGFEGLTPADAAEAARLRATPLLDIPAVARLKGRILRQLFDAFPWDAESRPAFDAFLAKGGEALTGHALFEALSATMVAKGGNAGWAGWPEPYRDRESAETRAFAAAHAGEIAFHLWLQWQADAQLARVNRAAHEAGMRVGLYLDFAVGAAPDGSAAWSDPGLTVPGLSIGAPPDAFSDRGQDWGLAPLSPIRLTELDARPVAETMMAVLAHASAIRIDHAMSLARLWLIPRGRPALEGAYVRYPLRRLLAAMAAASQADRALVIGEDLGVVPPGFRPLMAARDFHAYKVFFFEREGDGFADPKGWPEGALACIGTHDMPTFAGWWQDSDLRLRLALGFVTPGAAETEARERARDRDTLRRLLGDGEADGPDDDPARLSPRLHAHMASGPCRLAALQVEDALGLTEQVNVPGTIDEHPNWRRRLPLPVDRIAGHPGFATHAAAMRAARPR